MTHEEYVAETQAILQKIADNETKKMAFIKWLETYPLNKTCDFDTMIRAELLLEVIEKAKEML